MKTAMPSHGAIASTSGAIAGDPWKPILVSNQLTSPAEILPSDCARSWRRAWWASQLTWTVRTRGGRITCTHAGAAYIRILHGVDAAILVRHIHDPVGTNCEQTEATTERAERAEGGAACQNQRAGVVRPSNGMALQS